MTDTERLAAAGVDRGFAPDAGGRWHRSSRVDGVAIADCGAALAGELTDPLPEYVSGEDLCPECCG